MFEWSSQTFECAIGVLARTVVDKGQVRARICLRTPASVCSVASGRAPRLPAIPTLSPTLWSGTLHVDIRRRPQHRGFFGVSARFSPESMRFRRHPSTCDPRLLPDCGSHPCREVGQRKNPTPQAEWGLSEKAFDRVEQTLRYPNCTKFAVIFQVSPL